MTKKKKEDIALSYKIKMIIEIEGEVDGQRSLTEDTGIYPFVQWACDDIEDKLECICEVDDILEVNLKRKY